MSFNDCKISESEIQTTGVQAQADTLTGSAADNKLVFDALPTLVSQKLNSLIDQLQQQAAAGQVGVTPFDGMTAQTLQAALEQIQADIGGNYGGADGAGKVGYTPSEGVDEDTVQEAIEAVQANLAAYIAKIKAATGAVEVGNAPIVGMTATNVQQALEELRKNIDNIVSGIIPGGSITSDMIQDGAVTADKLGSDVTGDTIPTSASDPASISSQLSNRVLMPVQIPADADLNTLRTPGFYWCDGVTNANRPDDSGSFCLLIEKTGSWGGNGVKQTFTNYDSGAIYTRVSPKDIWNPWRLLATATPPQEFDLPLADNWTTQQASTYFKTQEGIVVARIAIKSTAEYTSGGLLFTLPEGFRPSENVEFPCTIKRADNLQASSIYFRTSGAASENHSGGAVLPVGTELYTLAIFIAAS